MDRALTEKPWTEAFVLTDRDRYESGRNYSGENVSVLSPASYACFDESQVATNLTISEPSDITPLLYNVSHHSIGSCLRQTRTGVVFKYGDLNTSLCDMDAHWHTKPRK